MRNLDERVAYMEARMDDHSSLIADVRGEMRDLRAEMRDLRSEVRTDIREVRTEIRDLRSEMNVRFDRMDQKFTWLVGMFVALLLGLLGVAAQVARLQPS
jgi:predicted  nucleic acid-binding Zn-ribbon protein